MSTKAIKEFDGKRLVSSYFTGTLGSTCFVKSPKFASIVIPVIPQGQANGEERLKVEIEKALESAYAQNSWLSSEKLVVKPDQLIKRRGKGGLLLLNADWKQVSDWIREKAGKGVTVDGVTGILRSFIVEPFIKHDVAKDEYYVCIQANRTGDEILFHHQGGIDVGDVDSKALRLQVGIEENLSASSTTVDNLSRRITEKLLINCPAERKALLNRFLIDLMRTFQDLHFAYLEINPLVVVENEVFVLDMAAKVDQTAEFACVKLWGGSLEFPAPFGRDLTREEEYIMDLDSKTGASLKLTILNKDGRIWTMVAGGGASVAYSDAIAALGFSKQLANYGEYSGAPSETQTYEYSKTILDLMTREDSKVYPEGKILIIGGGIANFTNVASTFKGIIRSLKEYKHQLIKHHVKIYIRRGGPNYEEGLRMMRELGDNLGVEMHVYGPETHITGIVPLALSSSTPGGSEIKKFEGGEQENNNWEIVPPSHSPPRMFSPVRDNLPLTSPVPMKAGDDGSVTGTNYTLFTEETRSFVYGLQAKAVQGMLDFDRMCKRETPSVAALIYPFGGSHVQKFYWGVKEILIPVFSSVKEAVAKYPEVDVVVNFASCRSVLESTLDLLENFSDRIKTIAIIAEGVPERHSRTLIKVAQQKGVVIIGPATVGGIKPGCFKIGNTGGMVDNIISSKLYRPGSVAYVSKSGGMSNELNNIISRVTNGVYEGIAIGGDRYPGTTFIDHMLRFEADPLCAIQVLLGEVGGVEELKIAEAVQAGRLKKPIVAWCMGTCASLFSTSVQFGHAGALANSNLETAAHKNEAMRKAGITVPKTFEDLPLALELVYKRLVAEKVILVGEEPPIPKVPMDYAWAQELGLIRKPAQFVSTICDDRGEELLYAGIPITSVIQEDIGIGGVLSLLWFKRRLPPYACKFIEMVLMLTADHGPAVSGAHNTIVTARAGKDLVSSIVSGLLTIGDRFGGALDGAAEQFSKAYDQGLLPEEFVSEMRKSHQLIMGIGHKIKSRTNPDMRVSIVKQYAKEHFPSTPMLDYALAVEKITTAKKENLILNVDGAVGVLFVDLLRGSGAFSPEESEEYIKMGALNGLFVLGRSIGFIGHYLDQKRLKQGLYRHPWDDISYNVGEGSGNN